MKTRTFFVVPLLCLSGCNLLNSDPTFNNSNKWEVKFMYNYDENDTVFKTYEIDHNTKINEENIEIPTREGYEFTKWYKDTYCKIEWEFKKDKVTSNTNLYAGWSKSNIESSNEYSINWENIAGVNYIGINGEVLPTTAKENENISFKITIDEAYTGNPIVYINNQVINDDNDIYTFTVTQNTTIKVEGIEKEIIQVPSTYVIKFTLPTWDPAASNPRLYYWGSESIDDSIFTLGAPSNMKLLEGMTYYIELSTSINFEGIIIIFDQGSEVKQSFDITNNLPQTAGNYIINVPDWSSNGWAQNTFGVWCFKAEIIKE